MGAPSPALQLPDGVTIDVHSRAERGMGAVKRSERLVDTDHRIGVVVFASHTEHRLADASVQCKEGASLALPPGCYGDGMPTTTLMQRLREALSARGVTQADLCRMTGLRSSSIANIYNGKTKGLRGESATVIARALQVNVAWLVDGKGPRDAGVGIEVTGALERAITEAIVSLSPEDKEAVLTDIRRRVEARGAEAKQAAKQADLALEALRTIPGARVHFEHGREVRVKK